jgi:hypothetical protein
MSDQARSRLTSGVMQVTFFVITRLAFMGALRRQVSPRPQHQPSHDGKTHGWIEVTAQNLREQQAEPRRDARGGAPRSGRRWRAR